MLALQKNIAENFEKNLDIFNKSLNLKRKLVAKMGEATPISKIYDENSKEFHASFT